MTDILTKVFSSFIVLVMVTFFAKIIVKYIIGRLVNFHKKHNKESLDKFPIKFLISYENEIIKYSGWFYYFGAVIIIISIWTGEIP